MPHHCQNLCVVQQNASPPTPALTKFIFSSLDTFKRIFIRSDALRMRKRYLRQHHSTDGDFGKHSRVLNLNSQMACPAGLTSASCYITVLEPAKEWHFIVESFPPRKRSELSPFVCQQCGPTKTVQTRRGPTGLRTLCNRCAISYRLFPYLAEMWSQV